MDIDIDLPSTFDPKKLFPEATLASMVQKGELKKHPVGVYFQNIAQDALTHLAAIPYAEAEEMGYFKIDFLSLTVLDNFESKAEIRQLLKIEPDWTLFYKRENVEKLFQIHKHYDTLIRIKPSSVQEVADTISLIRPGKKHLIDDYIKDRETTRVELYTKNEDDKYFFKRSHAISYALTIVLQLHLIKGGII